MFPFTGTTILIYTFPILLIATLASLYFHLEQKRSIHNTTLFYTLFSHHFEISLIFLMLDQPKVC